MSYTFVWFFSRGHHHTRYKYRIIIFSQITDFQVRFKCQSYYNTQHHFPLHSYNSSTLYLVYLVYNMIYYILYTLYYRDTVSANVQAYILKSVAAGITETLPNNNTERKRPNYSLSLHIPIRLLGFYYVSIILLLLGAETVLWNFELYIPLNRSVRTGCRLYHAGHNMTYNKYNVYV